MPYFKTSTKWKERKEALDALLELLKAPKLEEGRYGELLNGLAKVRSFNGISYDKRMNDSNVIVVALAANAIEKVALGLGHSFSQYKSLVSFIL